MMGNSCISRMKQIIIYSHAKRLDWEKKNFSLQAFENLPLLDNFSLLLKASKLYFSCRHSQTFLSNKKLKTEHLMLRVTKTVAVTSE